MNSASDHVTCPSCFGRLDTARDGNTDCTAEHVCPKCGHHWTVQEEGREPAVAASIAGTTDSESNDVNDSLVNNAKFINILKEEALLSTSLRKKHQLVSDEPAEQGPSLEEQAAAETRSGDMRLALVLVGTIAVLWLSFEFNDWLAEAVPAAAPLLNGYNELILDLADRIASLSG